MPEADWEKGRSAAKSPAEVQPSHLFTKTQLQGS